MSTDPRLTGDTPPALGARHPDTALVDTLTAYLNVTSEPSGADVVALISQLITASGRPLASGDLWPVHAEVDHDRYGLATATVSAGPYRVRVFQPADDSAELRIEVTSDGNPTGLAIALDDQPVLDATT